MSSDEKSSPGQSGIESYCFGTRASETERCCWLGCLNEERIEWPADRSPPDVLYSRPAEHARDSHCSRALQAARIAP